MASMYSLRLSRSPARSMLPLPKWHWPGFSLAQASPRLLPALHQENSLMSWLVQQMSILTQRTSQRWIKPAARDGSKAVGLLHISITIRKSSPYKETEESFFLTNVRIIALLDRTFIYRSIP